MSDQPAVSVAGLSHAFGNRQVLNHIDLEVALAEVLSIMGSSGGGKTTLLRCVAGLVAPTAGDILVDGINVREQPEEARLHMGMVFQSSALFDYMSVEENVLFGLRRLKRRLPAPPEKLSAQALERVGLTDSKHLMPAELSGGMRKRVGIARAIALQPKVMLYDEPTTGLDPVTTYSIDQLIMDLREAMGVTTIVVSHDVTSVVRTADRVAFLESGALVFMGPPQEFLSSDRPSISEVVHKAKSEAPLGRSG